MQKKGTVVEYSNILNFYCYEKHKLVNHQVYNYLHIDDVVNNNEYFIKVGDYPEHYAYVMPTYSRKDVLEIFEDYRNRYKNIKIESYSFEKALREFGRDKAKEIINNKKEYNE